MLLTLLVGCASQPNEGTGAGPDSADKADSRENSDAVSIGQGDDGATIDVTEGQLIVLELPSDPSTGFEWVVVQTDRSFGYPFKTDHVPDGESQELTVMQWHSKSLLGSLIGEHTVRLEYSRDDVVDDTFSFTAKIAAP